MKIVGYITRGVASPFTRALVLTFRNLMYQAERRIAVEWGGKSAATFPVQLTIRAKDRAGLLAEITAVISGAGSNIRNLESRPDRLNARIEASLEIADRRQLEVFSQISAKFRASTASSVFTRPRRLRILPVLSAGVFGKHTTRTVRRWPIHWRHEEIVIPRIICFVSCASGGLQLAPVD